MTNAIGLAVRMRRAAFNRALADADLSAIGPYLHQELFSSPGRTARSSQVARHTFWRGKRELADPDSTVYIRMPDQIIASPVEPIAMEHGLWRGARSGSETPISSGHYAAKWRTVGGEWGIEAEIHLTAA